MRRIVRPLVRERAGRHGIALHTGVDDAITFAPSGGRIEVRVKSRDGVIETSVSDTGVGIASGVANELRSGS
jgi:K+-sensing histidine kinase KdpD